MFDDELDILDKGKGSHWLRRLLFLALAAAGVYAYSLYKAKQSDQGELAVGDGWQRLTTTETKDAKEAEAQLAEPAETIVSVVEPTVVGEFILSDADVDDDNVEIDLAVEEEFEAALIGEDDDEQDEEIDEGIIEDAAEIDSDQDENEEFEGLLTRSDSDDNEQLLEPGPSAQENKWVQPINGQCPEGYPIKARFSTGRYHAPGDRGYEKINPDCCYANVEEAVADGFTHSRWS